MGQRLKVDAGEDEEGEGEEEEGEDGTRSGFGKKKRDYYNADNFDYEV